MSSRRAQVLAALSGTLAGTSVEAPAPVPVSVLDEVIDLASEAPDESPWWTSTRPVGKSEDLERVLALPRRPGDVETWVSPQVAHDLTERLRRPGGTRELRIIQTGALLDAAEQNGLVAPIGVGAGKTDTSALLPIVMRSRVAVLMVPPSLRAKFTEIEYPYLASQYRLPALAGSKIRYGDEPGVLHVVAYSQLSSQRGADILEKLQPDLIVCDEAQALRDSSAARTKRFRRYMKQHPECRLVVLSGTLTSRSLRDFAHLARLSLREKAPVPLSWPHVEEWAGALDVSDTPNPAGELRRFCKDDEEDVREGYQRRLRETPGWVSTGSDVLPTGLVISERQIETPPAVEEALTQLRETWVTPGGEEISCILDMVRYARQLATGMYTRWIWPRGEPVEVIREWKAARKEWHKEIREFLKYRSAPGLDSPGFLSAAAARWHQGYTHSVFGKKVQQIPPRTKDGPLPVWDAGTWERWKNIEPQAEPEDDVVWIDEFLARDAVEWGLGAGQAPGILWYEHDGLGRRIAEIAGPRFRHFPGGKKASEELLRLAAGPLGGSVPLVLSIKAHHHGKNLQAWNRNLLTTFPSGGALGEQILGRTHRSGQEADEVTAETYRHTPEMCESVVSARRDAQYQEQLLGSAQRLCYATYTF